MKGPTRRDAHRCGTGRFSNERTGRHRKRNETTTAVLSGRGCGHLANGRGTQCSAGCRDRPAGLRMPAAGPRKAVVGAVVGGGVRAPQSGHRHRARPPRATTREHCAVPDDQQQHATQPDLIARSTATQTLHQTGHYASSGRVSASAHAQASAHRGIPPLGVDGGGVCRGRQQGGLQRRSSGGRRRGGRTEVIARAVEVVEAGALLEGQDCVLEVTHGPNLGKVAAVHEAPAADELAAPLPGYAVCKRPQNVSLAQTEAEHGRGMQDVYRLKDESCGGCTPQIVRPGAERHRNGRRIAREFSAQAFTHSREVLMRPRYAPCALTDSLSSNQSCATGRNAPTL